MNKYEKPAVKFVALRSREELADKCWGLKDKDYNSMFYYDIKGKGWLSFHLKSASGNCGAPDAYEIKYYEDKNSQGVDLDKSGINFTENDLESILTQRGGNNGQPYSTISSDFPSNPDPKWS